MTEEIIDGEAEEITGTDVVPHNPGPPANLFHADTPEKVIEGATATADALKRVIEQKQLYKMIQGKQHVLVEGWTLLGTMLGVFPVLVWSRPIDETNVAPNNRQHGWEARVEARTMNGQVVGAGEGQCSRSENTWKNRDDYALRSMAQTRATSKALRQPLGFVMTLAGYDATPADEMPTTAEETTRRTPPAATAVAATQGRLDELDITVKLLQDAYPEAATPGKSWKQTAWQYGGEHLGFSPSGPITAKQANDLREWLEEQFRQLEMADSDLPFKAGEAESAFVAPDVPLGD